MPNTVSDTAHGPGTSGNTGAPVIHAPVVPCNTKLNTNVRKKEKIISQMLSVARPVVQVAPTNKPKLYKNVSHKGIISVTNDVNTTASGASTSWNAGAPVIHVSDLSSNTKLKQNIKRAHVTHTN